MAEIELTAEQAAELMRCTVRHARRLELGWHDSGERGRNGKQARKCSLRVLPAEAQARYLEEQRDLKLETRHSEGTEATRPAETLALFAPRETLALMIPATIAEEQNATVRARMEALEPLLDFRRRTNGTRPSVKLAGKTITNLAELAEWVGAQQGPAVTARTMFRWLARFDEDGIAGLAERPRRDAGRSKFFSEHRAARTFIEHKYLNEGLTGELAWEGLRREWKKFGYRGEQPPAYGTVTRYCSALPKSARVLGREGERKWDSQCMATLLRRPPAVMHTWVSDHRQFDVFVENDLWPWERPGEAMRPWLTWWVDWGSRKVLGWAIAPTPSSRTISSALRMALLAAEGAPAHGYTDNGKDYLKVGRDDDDLAALGVLRRLEVDVVRAIPKHPRSKPIESWFAGLAKRFDILWGAAYCGRSPEHRGPQCERACKDHEAYRAGKLARSPLPLASDFVRAAVQWMLDFNATPHTKLAGQSPDEAFDAGWPAARRQKIEPRLLDPLFWEREKRIVQRGGTVQLMNAQYEPAPEALGALALWQGREILVAWDPFNAGQALAMEPETCRLIGELRAQAFLEQGAVSRDAIQAWMRAKRGLKRTIKDQLEARAQIAASCGWKTESQVLIDRATACGQIAAVAGRPLQLPAGPKRAEGPKLAPEFTRSLSAEDMEIFSKIRTET